VSCKPKEAKTAGTWKSRISGILSPIFSSDDPTTDAGELPASVLGAGEPDSNDSEAVGLESSSNSSTPQSEDSTDILKTGSKSDLMTELLRMEDLGLVPLPIRFVNAQRRAKIASRLLELDVSESEEVYLISSLVGATFEGDSINKEGKLNASHARESLEQIREKYCDHPNALVSSKASLGFCLSHVHDFYESKDKFELTNAARQFELHADKILAHPPTVAFFAKFVVGKYRAADHGQQ